MNKPVNKIEKLIAELCPQGVEYKELIEIGNVTIGEFVHKNKQDPNGQYPVYNGGISPTGYYDEYNNSGEKIIISARGANAGFVNKALEPYWAGNSCYSVGVLDRNQLNWFFVFYYLKNNQHKLIGDQQKGGIPAVSKKQIETFKIPVPPLTIQQEIVKILDTFTTLEAELEAELETRKKQYEYYREELLTFGDDVKWKALDEVCISINAGGDLPKNYLKGQNEPTPDFPFPIYSNGTEENALYGYTDDYRIDNEAVTISARGTIGYHAVRSPKFTPIVRLLVLIPKKNIATPQFLNYVLDITEIGHSGGSIPQLTVPNVKKIKIPIPPLAEQERIVAVLDKFDALVNGTTPSPDGATPPKEGNNPALTGTPPQEGNNPALTGTPPEEGNLSASLPAELNARRKQYEYYRDKLLTFKEKHE